MSAPYRSFTLPLVGYPIPSPCRHVRVRTELHFRWFYQSYDQCRSKENRSGVRYWRWEESCENMAISNRTHDVVLAKRNHLLTWTQGLWIRLDSASLALGNPGLTRTHGKHICPRWRWGPRIKRRWTVGTSGIVWGCLGEDGRNSRRIWWQRRWEWRLGKQGRLRKYRHPIASPRWWSTCLTTPLQQPGGRVIRHPKEWRSVRTILACSVSTPHQKHSHYGHE